MGEHRVSTEQDSRLTQNFTRALLADLGALELMLEKGLIESSPGRIGAEQEMFLVDSARRPAPVVLDVLKTAGDERLTTEIGKFNLEANLKPCLLAGAGLREMEDELTELIGIARNAAREVDAEVAITGILPTIRRTDLTAENLTPSPRYFELNRAMLQLRGGPFKVHIKGLDELNVTHDSTIVEACCASFQVHLQVDPKDFARLYNFAQAITGPILAVAANSPLLLGHRLWHETRIPLFQHSTDERSSAREIRSHPSRVSFGDGWIENSVIEIFREEIARFRVMLTREIDEDPMEMLARGELPRLAALRLHNGTVWRWNRPCYGVTEGRAHLRIEHRPMPAGPSVIDEMANAALFFGLMYALPEEYGEIDKLMSFDDAKSNFFAAGRHGLKTQFTWIGGRDLPASILLLEQLIPMARKGLKTAGVDDGLGDRYLDVVEERVRSGQTGAVWLLNSLAGMAGQGTSEIRHRTLVEAAIENQISGEPVHTWEPAKLSTPVNWFESYQKVGQVMSTDLFTVRPNDLVDLAASVMDWKHVRHVPVEDDNGNLVGLVSHRDLLRFMAKSACTRRSENVTVSDIMTREVITVTPETPTLFALETMRNQKVGCLPVIDNGRLVGIVTAYDFLALSAEIIEQQLKGLATQP